MKKLLAISLALILLSSNIGLTMATHFCGGQAVKSQLMVGHIHLDCGMPGMDMPAEQEPEKGESHLKGKGCCENHYQTLEIDDDYHSGLFQLSLNFDFVVAFAHSILNVGLFSVSEKPQYANYYPPLLLRDIPVLNQVFII